MYIYVQETSLHLYINVLLISGVTLEWLLFSEGNIFLQAVKY